MFLANAGHLDCYTEFGARIVTGNPRKHDQFVSELKLRFRILVFTPVPDAPTVLGIRGGGVEWLLRHQ